MQPSFTDCGMRIAVRNADCRLPIADSGLPIADCVLPAKAAINGDVIVLTRSHPHDMPGQTAVGNDVTDANEVPYHSNITTLNRAT